MEEILNIHKIVTKPLDTNTYLITSEKTKKAIIVDPGFESFDRIMALVKKEDTEIVGIYLTHSHFDHIADVARFQRELDLKALDIQRRGNESQMDMQRKSDEFDERIDVEKMKLENQETQSNKRIQVAKEKIQVSRDKLSTSTIPK